MHQTLTYTLLILTSLFPQFTPAKPHNLLTPYIPPPPQQQHQHQHQQEDQPCSDPNSPKSFSFHGITYLQHTTSPYQFSPQPNSTQLAFELVNENTGVSTGCACQIVMDRDGDWAGNDGEIQYACVDRTITVGDAQYPVKTSARVFWDDWLISVNQTWSCADSMTISQFSTLTLTPTCNETTSAFQYIKECTAPDVIIAATSGKDIVL
ncbi:hypothetical protein F5Y08DRAFT_334084 [Xylaria arbuscula]|nr:hypothetical protein F5Y08DRAFT_334084 [Xylaria arbuscula]